MADKLVERRDALKTILQGGILIEGETEEDEIQARNIYNWLDKQLTEAENALAERDMV